jgi:hypothetical protein
LHNCIVKLLLLLFNLGRKAKKWKREWYWQFQTVGGFVSFRAL